jgi:hypothetical protein
VYEGSLAEEQSHGFSLNPDVLFLSTVRIAVELPGVSGTEEGHLCLVFVDGGPAFLLFGAQRNQFEIRNCSCALAI